MITAASPHSTVSTLSNSFASVTVSISSLQPLNLPLSKEVTVLDKTISNQSKDTIFSRPSSLLAPSYRVLPSYPNCKTSTRFGPTIASLKKSHSFTYNRWISARSSVGFGTFLVRSLALLELRPPFFFLRPTLVGMSGPYVQNEEDFPPLPQTSRVRGGRRQVQPTPGPPSQSSNAGRGNGWGEREERTANQAPFEGHSAVANPESVTYVVEEATRASSAASRVTPYQGFGTAGGNDYSTAEAGNNNDTIIGAAPSASSRGFAGRSGPQSTNRVLHGRNTSGRGSGRGSGSGPQKVPVMDSNMVPVHGSRGSPDESRASGSSSNPGNPGVSASATGAPFSDGPYMGTRSREALSEGRGVATSAPNGEALEGRDADGDQSMEGEAYNREPEGWGASGAGSQSSGGSPTHKAIGQRPAVGQRNGILGKAFSSTAGGTTAEGWDANGAIDSPIEGHSSAGPGAPPSSSRRKGWGGGGGSSGANLKFVSPDNGGMQRPSAEATSAGSSMGRSSSDSGFKRSRDRTRGGATGKLEERNGNENVVLDDRMNGGDDMTAGSIGPGQLRSQRGGGSWRSAGREAQGGREESYEAHVEALGRLLSNILRHQAVRLQLAIRPDGYVRVKELLNLNERTRTNRLLSSFTEEDMREVVRMDNKQRFGITNLDGDLHIRANQGHTLKVVESDKLLKPIESPDQIPVCVHGTYNNNLVSIFKSGLRRMQRNHIHFATGLPEGDGVISGMRSTCQVLIFLNVLKVLEDKKFKLYLSENNVILSEGIDGVIPKEYFLEVKNFPSMEPIPIP